MREITFDEMRKLIDEGKINYFNFYNLSLPSSIALSIDYYTNNPHDRIENKSQKVSVLYLDIEVYVFDRTKRPDPTKHPICAFTCVMNNDVYSYCLLPENTSDSINNDDIISDVRQELSQISRDYNINIYWYRDDKELIKRAWMKIRELDPCLISGWNIDEFDISYIVERMKHLYPDSWQNILSRFGKVEKNFSYYEIPEFGRYDLMYMYKPRDEGGLNYGSKQVSYSLDYISTTVLGIGKMRHNIDLNTLFETNVKKLVAYNIVDTILCQLLDERFKFYNLHNTIRRMMGTSYTLSLQGWSRIFEAYVNKTLIPGRVRYGFLDEMDFETKNLNKTKVRSKTRNYVGAYVKQPKPGLYDKGLLLDLDASALYPSMIMQFNISFDTLVGKIIDPVCYTAINSLKNAMAVRGEERDKLFSKIEDAILSLLAKKFGRYVKGQIKLPKEISELAEVVIHIIEKLKLSNLSLDDLFKTTSNKAYIYLKRYFLSLMDIILSLKSDYDYNTFVYDYIFKPDKVSNIDKIYVYLNPYNSGSRVEEWTVETLKDRLNKDLILTLTGCLFYKHDKKKGLFFDLLTVLRKMRKEYDEMAAKTSDPVLSEMYSMYAWTCKIIANTTYGLFGTPSFVFSNHWLASTVTTQGRMTVKLAQYIAEKIIREKYTKEVSDV